MEKNCENCKHYYTEDENGQIHEFCSKYDCYINEVVKEIKNPSCYEETKKIF